MRYPSVDERHAPGDWKEKIDVGDERENETEPRIDVCEPRDEGVTDDAVSGEGEREKAGTPGVHAATSARAHISVGERVTDDEYGPAREQPPRRSDRGPRRGRQSLFDTERRRIPCPGKHARDRNQ